MAAQTPLSRSDTWSTNENEFISFSDLPLLIDDQRTAQVTTPALAMSWADAIVTYWKRGISTSVIRDDQPLYLLDLQPRQGRFVWLLLNALSNKLRGSTLKSCYLACSTRIEALKPFSQHPDLHYAITDGSFDTALLSPSFDSLHLQHQNHSLLRTDNPIVVIGLGHFQTLPSELYGVHHGTVIKGRVTVNHNQIEEFSRLTYQWREATAPAFAKSLLDIYLARCSSASVTLPKTACSQLDGLSRISSGRYFLLSADVGVCSEQAIRLGALRPPAEMAEGGIVIPVNTHALQLHQQLRGALTWHQQLCDDGCAIFLTSKNGDIGDNGAAHAQTFEYITYQLSEANPDDFCCDSSSLLDSSNPAGTALTLHAIRRSHYDPQLLKTIIQGLIDRPEMMEVSLRRSWQEALVRTMENYFPNAINDRLYYQAGLCATQLGDFGAARHYFQRSMDWYGEDATELYLLAYCEAASGGVMLAHQLLQRALYLDPQHSHCLHFLSQIDARLTRWQSNRWYLPQVSQEGELRLEPLGAEHAASFLYQYRDEQIGIMTRLPDLTTIDQVQDWVVEQAQDEGRASFAVMHENWGLVGVVSIQVAGAAGYFYFWIGSDFQDQGLGQQAAPLLFDMMTRHGVTDIFTSAYDDNIRSIHALKKLGFDSLAVLAKEPDDKLAFFHLNRCVNHSEDAPTIKLALRELCRAIDSSLQFSG
ncbi:GNAT family N-acetyltransferase [Undibacterium sp. Xuan67W]|uniref:GNAT family N-acetyltransferase n=1 Tax=Undibacterium sp. Xuan67W TaxID=3413057 RepID=UPI003BF224D0